MQEYSKYKRRNKFSEGIFGCRSTTGISGSCSRGLGWIWASLTCSSNLFRLSPGKNERQNDSFEAESYNFSGEQVPHVLWGPGASQWEEWSGETGWDLSRVLWDGKTGKPSSLQLQLQWKKSINWLACPVGVKACLDAGLVNIYRSYSAVEYL